MQFYLLEILCTVMFSTCFCFYSVYQKQNGSSFFSSMFFSFVTGIFGMLSLLIINDFSIHATTFTIIMASITAINSVFCSYFSIKTIGYVNLSLYSLFVMSGGLVIPSAVGLIVFKDDITVAKILCFVFVICALLCTVEKDKKKRNCAIYYFGVFFMNGLSGALGLFFQQSRFNKASEADYSLWSGLFSWIIAILIVICSFVKKNNRPKVIINKKLLLIIPLYGVINQVANLLSLIVLKHLPGSITAPICTGGVIISSTLMSSFTDKKPNKRDWISVAFALCGVCSLLIPVMLGE